MPKHDNRIGTVENKLRQLKTPRQRDDTRRRILVGAVVLAKVDEGVLKEELLREWLDAALSNPEDRELFNLPVGGG